MNQVKKVIEDPIFKFAYMIKSEQTNTAEYIKSSTELTVKELQNKKRKFAKANNVELQSVEITQADRPTVLHAIGEPALIKQWGKGREEQWWHQGRRYRNTFYREDGSVYNDTDYTTMLPENIQAKIKRANCLAATIG